jgi:DNA replication protein DnaC
VRVRIQKERDRELDQDDVIRLNIGELHWEVQFDRIPDTLPHHRIIRKFIENISDHIFEGRGLLLWGDYGTGKTAIGAIICKEVVKRLGTAYMISAMDLADAVIGKEWFDKDETVAQRLLSVDLLVVDELGGGQADRTGWNKAYVERIVRSRTRVRKSTICISNLSLSELKAHYGGGLIAIMGEKIYPIEVKGKNWREDKRNDLKRIFED